MYGELIKSLRICGNADSCDGCMLNTLIDEENRVYGCGDYGGLERTAADVIEELNSRPRDTKYIADVIKMLPIEVWYASKQEVIETGNHGLWETCCTAIEHLSEFWKEYYIQTIKPGFDL